MKHSVLGRIGALLLLIGSVFAVPAYAENEHESITPGESNAQQMSQLISNISREMEDMSGIIEKGNTNPDTMKKMSQQMKQMSSMMNNMSEILNKYMAMDANTQQQMGQMRKQIDQMSRDIPDSAANR